VVTFTYGSLDLQALFDLEDELIRVIAEAQVGDLDGEEVAVDGSHGFLFMYGPDGDRLFDVVRPVLEACQHPKSESAVIRYGPPVDGVEERTVVFGEVT